MYCVVRVGSMRNQSEVLSVLTMELLISVRLLSISVTLAASCFNCGGREGELLQVECNQLQVGANQIGYCIYMYIEVSLYCMYPNK